MDCSTSTGAVPKERSALRSITELGSGVGTAPPGWSHCSLLELGSLPTAPACGRAHTRQVLQEWDLGHLVDEAVTLVSELLTNALQASWALESRPPIVLRLLANDEQLIIEAWDQLIERYPPLPQAASEDGEHGRGLQVVSALSNRWGVGRITDDYKAVWAELLTAARVLKTLSPQAPGTFVVAYGVCLTTFAIPPILERTTHAQDDASYGIGRRTYISDGLRYICRNFDRRQYPFKPNRSTYSSDPCHSGADVECFADRLQLGLSDVHH